MVEYDTLWTYHQCNMSMDVNGGTIRIRSDRVFFILPDQREIENIGVFEKGDSIEITRAQREHGPSTRDSAV